MKQPASCEIRYGLSAGLSYRFKVQVGGKHVRHLRQPHQLPLGSLLVF